MGADPQWAYAFEVQRGDEEISAPLLIPALGVEMCDGEESDGDGAEECKGPTDLSPRALNDAVGRPSPGFNDDDLDLAVAASLEATARVPRSTSDADRDLAAALAESEAAADAPACLDEDDALARALDASERQQRAERDELVAGDAAFARDEAEDDAARGPRQCRSGGGERRGEHLSPRRLQRAGEVCKEEKRGTREPHHRLLLLHWQRLRA